MRDWILDSGAFSAFTSGKTVTVEQYTDVCINFKTFCIPPVEMFALDVIGSWEGGLKNTEYMWKKGIPAIPTFHYGEPWDVLLHLAATYPKIAIGAMVGQNPKIRHRWIEQCFARVWPKKIHGFGLTSEKVVLCFPFHSVDSTDWEIKPAKFGTWRAFGHEGNTSYMNWKGSKQNLLSEIEYYLDLEQRARVRWHKEMKLLEEL